MKKKGFTLIELLAVIIVLAIIALIATPIIFNVIENAKLKSLENSCYGIIDTVRTNYAENLLNSTDGQVKLKGSVTELTVAGEQPIQGTWEIDNTVDSNDRGIKIKDVKFASMKDYTCTNVNSDGTINSKVMCTKDSNNVVETSLSCFNYIDILDYEINQDGCIAYLKNEFNSEDTGLTDDMALGICNDSMNNPYYIYRYFSEYLDENLAKDTTLMKQLTDQGVITPKIAKKEFNINIDKCITFISENMFGGGTLTDTQLAGIKGMCEGNIPIEGDTYIKDMLVDKTINGEVDVNFVKELDIVDEFPTRRIVTGYTCDSKDVVIPSSVTSIVDAAFEEKQLTNLDFSKAENLEIIGVGAFRENLFETVTIPETVKIIGTQSFKDGKLSSVKIDGNVKMVGMEAFYNNQLKNVELQNGIEVIDQMAFSGNKLTNVIIPNSVTKIGGSAFSDNQLTTIEIPNSVTEIGQGAFKGNKLASVEIPSGIKEIGTFVFADNQLTNVIIPNNIAIIGSNAFENNQLTNVEIPNSVKEIDQGAFESNKLVSVVIPNSVTKIGSYTFSDNQLTTIEIPNSVTEIGQGAFRGNKLASVEIPSSLKEIESLVFADNQLTSVVIPNSVVKISWQSFENNQITSITIPSSVKEIEERAFNNNQLSDDDAFIYARTDKNNDGIAEIDTTTIVSYGGMKKDNVIIPNSVITIGNGAFEGNQLTSIIIPNGVTKIGSYAFRSNQLTTIEIPNSVKEIGNEAFYKNYNLKTITIDNTKDAITGSPWGTTNATITWKRS